MSNLIQAVASGLEMLYLQFLFSDVESMLLVHGDLVTTDSDMCIGCLPCLVSNSHVSLCTNLRSLSFKLLFPSRVGFESITSLLALIPRSAPVECFVLKFQYDYTSIEGCEFLDEHIYENIATYDESVDLLENLLCGPASLKEVTIRPTSAQLVNQEDVIMSQWLRRKLSRLETKVGLTVHWGAYQVIDNPWKLYDWDDTQTLPWNL